MWFYLKLPRSPKRVSSFRKWVYPVFLILPFCLRKGFRVSMEYPAYRMKKTRAPLSGNLVLHFGNRVLHLVIGYPIPETRYPFHQQNGSLTKTGYPTRETGFSFILSGYPFRKSGYSIRETRYPILNTGYQLLGTHFRRPAMTNFSNFWRFWAGVQKS